MRSSVMAGALALSLCGVDVDKLKEYPVTAVVRVKDGDSVQLIVDQGMNTLRRVNVRLLGVSAPELTCKKSELLSKEVCDERRSRAVAALGAVTKFLSSSVQTGQDLVYVDRGPDKFGDRRLGLIKDEHGAWLHETLLKGEFAKAWCGKGRAPQ